MRAAGIDQRVIACSPLGEGVKSRVYRVELDSGRALALKLYRETQAAQREQSGYKRLAGCELPFPQMVGGEVAAGLAEHGWTLMSIAPGEALNLRLATLDRSQLLAIYRQVGGLLARLHSLGCETFTRFRGEPVADRQNFGFVREWTEELLARFERAGGGSDIPAEVRALIERHAVDLGACETASLCHGDLHAENIRIDARGGLVGAIDLEECFAGDPALDIVQTHHARHPFDDAALAALLDGYGGAPPWFEAVFDPYFVICELRLWLFFARGGSRAPLRDIERRIAERLRRRY